MLAVLRHELRQHFNSLTAYVFGAFLLFFIGLYTMVYNLKSAIANFEYVLASVCLVFIILIPLLTMRTIAEEKRQKTDQLLYSLPLSMTQIIVGKYLALLVVFALPMLIVCLYPLMLHQFGDVYLPISYGTIVAFFFLGAALIAIGMFVSSLTETQAMAAGICFVVMIMNYYIVSLTDYASSTELGSFIFTIVMVLMLCLLIRALTKSYFAAGVFGMVVMLGLMLFFMFSSESFAGFLPDLMEKISLFERFYVFVNGVFDLNNIVYYLSVIVFFLFLCVQSMEKRRYS